MNFTRSVKFFGSTVCENETHVGSLILAARRSTVAMAYSPTILTKVEVAGNREQIDHADLNEPPRQVTPQHHLRRVKANQSDCDCQNSVVRR